MPRGSPAGRGRGPACPASKPSVGRLVDLRVLRESVEVKLAVRGAARALNMMATDDSLSWLRLACVFGLGFLPVAEGNVAVPTALAFGMHPALAVALSVTGTTTQTLLVRGLSGWLLTFPRVAAWWERHLAARARRLFARGAPWAVAVGIPWLGGGPMALAGRMAGMSTARYAGCAVGGLLLHASILALVVRLGLHAAGR